MKVKVSASLLACDKNKIIEEVKKLNGERKMKKFKKLIPAFCAMLVSAAMLGTSTYAWFSVNK